MSTVPARRPGDRLQLVPALAALLFVIPPARADDPPPPEHRWLGAAQAGLLIASGNADSRSMNAKVDVARTDGPWKNVVHAAGFYGSANGNNDAERIEGRWELDHQLGTRLFAFGSVDGNRDRFSGFNYQADLTGGLGYKFFDTDATRLSATLGAGYQWLQPQQLIKNGDGIVVQRINGPTSHDVIATAGLDFLQKLGASTRIGDKLQATSGSANTAVANDVSLIVAMNARLALSVGYGVRYNTTPAAGTKKLDQLTTINFVYNLK